MSLLELFCDVDDFLLRFEPQWKASQLQAGKQRERAGQLAQLARRIAGEKGQLARARAIDQTIFQVDSDLGVGPLEKFLDLAEQRFVHKTNPGRRSSSR